MHAIIDDNAYQFNSTLHIIIIKYENGKLIYSNILEFAYILIYGHCRVHVHVHPHNCNHVRKSDYNVLSTYRLNR